MHNELPSTWKKAQALAVMLASVLIPLVIAFLGHIFNQAIKSNEVALNYVQLAVGILKEKPTPDTQNLRAWAIDIVNNYSSVELTKDARNELKRHSLPIIDATTENPLAERARRLRDRQEQSGDHEESDSLMVEQHVLVDATGMPVSVVEAKFGGRKLTEHKLIVLHSQTRETAEQTVNRMATQHGGSTHVVIGREGDITQLVAFDYMAGHVGRSQWKNLTGLNKYSIGIVLTNAGQLQKKGDVWVSLSGETVPASEVYTTRNPSGTTVTGWQKYTDAQLEAAKKVVFAVAAAYPTIKAIVGRSEVSPGKTDPGPAFPLDEFKYIFNEAQKH